jgi:hypothetical protein
MTAYFVNLRHGGREASYNSTAEGQADQIEDNDTITRLMKKYPWWA